MADVYLVCEGPANGLDVRVLNAVLAVKLDAAVKIIPAGGDKNLAGVRTYLEEKSRHSGPGELGAPEDRALSIEDRNHRPRSAADGTWSGSDKNLVWRRHEIENYLLEPRIVDAAFESFRRTASRP